MNQEDWDEYKRKSKTWSVRIDFELLHSEAFKALEYAPAIKVLNWFHEKVKIKVNKRKRGHERYQVFNGDLSFTYAEGERRGLTHQQFAKALREIHKVGFIDVKKPGSRLKNDYTIFDLSNRWRDFGTPEFKEVAWEKSIKWRNFGFKGNEKESPKKRGKRHLLSMNSHTIREGR